VYGVYQVTGSNDFTLKLWDIKTGQEKSKLTGHMSAITSVSYSVSGVLVIIFFKSFRIFCVEFYITLVLKRSQRGHNRPWFMQKSTFLMHVHFIFHAGEDVHFLTVVHFLPVNVLRYYSYDFLFSSVLFLQCVVAVAWTTER